MLSHDIVIVGGGDDIKPARLAWLPKRDLLPPIYCDAMLKGQEWLAAPKPLRDAGG